MFAGLSVVHNVLLGKKGRRILRSSLSVTSLRR